MLCQKVAFERSSSSNQDMSPRSELFHIGGPGLTSGVSRMVGLCVARFGMSLTRRRAVEWISVREFKVQRVAVRDLSPAAVLRIGAVLSGKSLGVFFAIGVYYNID